MLSKRAGEKLEGSYSRFVEGSFGTAALNIGSLRTEGVPDQVGAAGTSRYR